MNTPLSYLNVFYEAEYFIKYMFAFLKCEFVGEMCPWTNIINEG